MPEIVVSDRIVPRALAVLPAVVLAACVRVLTLGTPPLAARLAAAAVVVLTCWSAYRLLTAAVTVTDAGVRVRGILYDAEVPWSDVASVEVVAAPTFVRAMLWGVLAPHAVVLRCAGRTLRPVGMLSTPDDEDVERAVRAITVRCGAWRMPAQRPPVDLEQAGSTAS
jgi:hypothetical protein